MGHLGQPSALSPQPSAASMARQLKHREQLGEFSAPARATGKRLLHISEQRWVGSVILRAICDEEDSSPPARVADKMMTQLPPI